MILSFTANRVRCLGHLASTEFDAALEHTQGIAPVFEEPDQPFEVLPRERLRGWCESRVWKAEM